MNELIVSKNGNLTMSRREIKASRIGHLYAIEADSGMVKIGRTKNPKRRIATLRSMANASGRVWISSLLPDSVESERYAHKRFSEERGNGEWFRVDFETAVEFLEGFNEQEISEEEAELAKKRRVVDLAASMDKFFARWEQKRAASV